MANTDTTSDPWVELVYSVGFGCMDEIQDMREVKPEVPDMLELIKCIAALTLKSLVL